MSSNYLNLNTSKTEFLLIGLPQQTSKIIKPSLFLTSTPIPPTSSAMNLGFIFDSNLSFPNKFPPFLAPAITTYVTSYPSHSTLPPPLLSPLPLFNLVLITVTLFTTDSNAN